MSSEVMVDGAALREEVRKKYREVATDPHGDHHFHTGRFLAAHLGYDTELVDPMPDVAVESYAGVANPFSLRIESPPGNGSWTWAQGAASTASSRLPTWVNREP